MASDKGNRITLHILLLAVIPCSSWPFGRRTDILRGCGEPCQLYTCNNHILPCCLPYVYQMTGRSSFPILTSFVPFLTRSEELVLILAVLWPCLVRSFLQIIHTDKVCDAMYLNQKSSSLLVMGEDFLEYVVPLRDTYDLMSSSFIEKSFYFEPFSCLTRFTSRYYL